MIQEAGAICLRRGLETKQVEVLLIRSTKKGEPWLFPKGHVEQDENAEQCAIRELEEETGYVGYVLFKEGDIEVAIAAQDYAIEYFRVKICGRVSPKDAARKYFWCPLRDAVHILPYKSAANLIREISEDGVEEEVA